jgi:diguanylate cyclase (GGDEF)-like protein
MRASSLVLFVVLLFAGPPVAKGAEAVTVLHATRGGPAFVVGPQRAERMTVVVRGVTSVVGRGIPLGASRLGHGVTAVQLPPNLRAEEPIVVRVTPAGAGLPRIVADEPAIDLGIASARLDGIMLGVLAALLVLQLAGWTITRDPSIPLYGLFIATFGVIGLERDGLFPLPPGIPPLAVLLLVDIVNGVANVAFVAVYLRLWQDDRKLLWLLVAGTAPVLLAAIPLALAPALRPYTEALRAPLLFIGCVTLTTVTLLRAQRFPPAWSLSTALGMTLLSVVYRTVRDLTPFSNPFLDRWTFELATSADVLLFGLAIIVRARYVVGERHALKEQLDRATIAADHDLLTGALNRRGLLARTAALHNGTLFAIDLDGFKAINDRFGHAAGDAILVEVVAALRALLPPEGLIARMGGDEFVVVIPEESEPPDGMVRRFSAAIAAIEARGRLRGDGFGASIGSASLAGMTFENALRIADTKAYRSKSAKRGAAG